MPRLPTTLRPDHLSLSNRCTSRDVMRLLMRPCSSNQRSVHNRLLDQRSGHFSLTYQNSRRSTKLAAALIREC